MRSDAIANRQHILEAATTLFLANGDAVSMRAIAQHAGVGMGTLYRNFPDREALIIGLAEAIFEKISLLVRETPPPSTVAQWDEFVDALVTLNIGGLIPIFTSNFPQNVPKHIWKKRTNCVTEIESIVAAAREAGILREDISANRLLLGIIFATRPLPTTAPEQAHADSGWILDNFLRSIKRDS